MLRFSFRLQPTVETAVMSRKEKLLSQLGPKFLGLHVRRGDQCQPEALARKNTTCFDLHDYMVLPRALSVHAYWAAAV